MTAAPLKRGGKIPYNVVPQPFPRSHDRGPIEAPRLGVFNTASNFSFPRSHDRGPIEAIHYVGGCVCIFGFFPRSHDRGPIEALWHLFIPIFVKRTFRGHMTAAPLKP